MQCTRKHRKLHYFLTKLCCISFTPARIITALVVGITAKSNPAQLEPTSKGKSLDDLIHDLLYKRPKFVFQKCILFQSQIFALAAS